MNFFYEDFKDLPVAQYYFNILVKTIAINPQHSKEVFDNNSIKEIYYIDGITEPHPYMVCFYINKFIDRQVDFEIQYYPHCVVGITKDSEVQWWDMIDFDTQDPWNIEPEMEEQGE